MYFSFVSFCLPITIIYDSWAQARGRILSHFSRSLTLTSPDQSMSETIPRHPWRSGFMNSWGVISMTPRLFTWRFFKTWLSLSSLVTNQELNQKPDLPCPLDYHFKTLPSKISEPHLRNFPASQSNLFNCPDHRKDSSKIASCYAIPLLSPDCTSSQPL